MSAVLHESTIFIGAALLVLTWAIVTEKRSVQQYKESNKVIKVAIKYLKEIRTNNGTVIIKRTDVDSKLGEQLGRKTWNWINEYITGDLISKEYKTPVADDRFLLLQYPNVLARSVPRSSLYFVPTLLTAIGLLGTFFGISSGLSTFDLSAIADGTKLLAASIQVLGGMKTAFTSSLVGLGCASLFMLVLAWGSSARKKHQDNLRENLDEIAVLPRTEDDNQIATQALKDAAQSMKSLSSQAIGKAVGAELNPVFQQIRQELSTLREIKADQGQEVLKNLIQELRTDVLQPIAQRLDRSAELTQSASQAVMNLQAELGTVSKSLADSILTIEHFQKETLGRLEEFAGGLKQTLGQFQTQTKTVLQEVAQEIKQGVDHSILGMEAQRVAFTSSAEQAAATFRGIREDLQAALHTQAEVEKQMLQEVQQRTVEILDAANTTFGQQAHTLEAVGNEASHLMCGAKAELLTGLQEINGMLYQTHQTTQQELEHFRQNYQASLQEFFNQSSMGMESQRVAFAESTQQAAATFRGIREDLQAALHTQAEVEKQMLQEVQQRTVEILDAANTTFGQQAQTLEAVGNEASHLMRGAKAELLTGLQEINGMLYQTHQTTQSELEHFRQNYQASLQEFFSQSSMGMESQRVAFTQSTQQAAATFRGIREDLQAALHTQAEVEKQMLQNVEARMSSILKDTHTAFQTQTDTLKATGNEASALMNHAKENLVGSLQNIDGMLQNTRQTVQDELERFREGYQTSLQDFFTQQNNLLESTLGAQRQGLAQVVEDLQTAFKKEATKRQELAAEVDRSMTKIQGTVEVVSNLANAVGLNSGARLAQMQELSRDMGTQVLELKSAYQNLANQFNQSLQNQANQFSQSLMQGNEQLTSYLHRAVESEKQFFTQADQATAQLCNSLLQAANYLVAAEDNRRRE